MKQNRKGAACLAGLLTGCLLFSACGKPEQPDPVRVTLMHGWGGASQDHVEMRRIYDAFAAANPDIELVYDSSPDISVVMQKANNMLAVDRMPDIISTNSYTNFVSNAKIKGTALNLAPYLAADAEFAANVSDSVRNTWTDPDGAIYTLPDAQEVIGYWYNEDLLRQAGVTETGNPAGKVKLPQTWEEFWQACDALAAVQGSTGAAPMLMQLDQLRVLLGARLAANDNASRRFMQGQSDGCDPADVQATVQDMARAISYYAGEPLSESDVRQLFLDGKSALYFNGVWANTEQGQTTGGETIRYAAFPSQTAGGVAYVSPGSGYVVSNVGTEQEIEARIRFLKYMLSESVQKQIVTQTRQAPSNPKISTAWIEEQVPVLGEALDACYTAKTQILSLYTILDYKNSAALDDAIQKLLQGEDSTAAFLSILTGQDSVS